MHRLRPRPCVAAAVALTGLVAVSAAADARVALTPVLGDWEPVLGDWEGVGPRGLPLSFDFTHERVRIAGRTRTLLVMNDLVVSYPTGCAQVPDNSQGLAYPRAGYTGPGSPPVTFHFRNPNRFEIYIGSAPGFNVGLGFFLQGRWLSARRGVLSQPIFRGGLRGCGWPTKTLAWQVRPGTRVRVELHALLLDVVSGSVSARVGGGGRTVDRFHLTYSCSDGASSSVDFAPTLKVAGKPTSLFVSASGAFAGTTGNVNGVQIGWSGTFGSDGVLRGTFTDGNACKDHNGALTGTFSARHPAQTGT